MKAPQEFDYAENAAWRMFRIMGEFTNGFEFISKLKNSVTIFGSARIHETNHWYKETQKLALMLTKKGYHVVTGGGPGIMEAANRGAFGGTPGDSIGLNIQLPKEQRVNPYVERSMAFHYFFTRKVCMSFSANAFVYFPGGYGTFDEFFEIVTLVQTKKIESIPLILIGKDFWKPFIDVLKEKMLDDYATIDKADLKLFELVNTAEEAFKIIDKNFKKKKKNGKNK
ncbi:MAG TPA: TIGR00730 family Rossman fold protein [Patescibacteria group bacterium]|nr:TIGR00730 family Rossman fold protein [Patescibacteria group bacterium]